MFNVQTKTCQSMGCSLFKAHFASELFCGTPLRVTRHPLIFLEFFLVPNKKKFPAKIMQDYALPDDDSTFSLNNL